MNDRAHEPNFHLPGPSEAEDDREAPVNEEEIVPTSKDETPTHSPPPASSPGPTPGKKQGKKKAGAKADDEQFNTWFSLLEALLVTHVHAEAMVFYDVGVIVVAILGDAHYGDMALKKMARKLKTSDRSLREKATVARAYTREEAEAFIKTEYRGQRVFTYSHLLLLARIHDPAVRARLTQEVCEKGLSIKALNELKARVGETPVPSKPPASARKALQALSLHWGVEAQNLPRSTKEIFDMLSDTKLNDEERRLLQESRTNLLAMHKTLDEAVQAIDGKLAAPGGA